MRIYFAVTLVLLLTSCSSRRGGIIIAGSTSVQPFIEKLADEFMAKNPDISISVQGGGSSAGIQATYSNTCNIGTSSRNLKQSEAGLKVFLLALDGIALIVHRTNPVASLTEEQVRNIFSGRIKNWQDVGGRDLKIFPVTREEGSGTRATFEDQIMKETAINDACLVQDSNGAVREIIATTPQGIGYISAGLIDDRIKALALDSIAPTFKNFTSYRYKLVRPFLLLTKEEPTGATKKFIDYALSVEAQDILERAGLISEADMKHER